MLKSLGKLCWFVFLGDLVQKVVDLLKENERLEVKLLTFTLILNPVLDMMGYTWHDGVIPAIVRYG